MLKKLFLSYYHKDSAEVAEIARALRLRGIIPWVDKDGGFSVADHSEREARRALREDCFGLCLYATAEVFSRPFIRDVEIDEAVKLKRADPTFLLFAIPRGISFDALKERSSKAFSYDLSSFHTEPIPSPDKVRSVVELISTNILERSLRRAHNDKEPKSFSLQFSTRERMPDGVDDILRIDFCGAFANGCNDAGKWGQLLSALRDVKRQIADTWGRPRLKVHGSKHMSAAFMFGRVFAPFSMDIRQTPEAAWSTDGHVAELRPFEVRYERGEPGVSELCVEIASGVKDIRAGTDLLRTGGLLPRGPRLTLRPCKSVDVGNSLCLSMAVQAYREIETVCATVRIDRIHLFAAVPQALLMMLGRLFRGMPEVLVYEWENGQYVPACRIPPGAL